MAELIGTPENDDGVDNPALIGTAGDDVISGFNGSDLLEGLDGNDFLSPGLYPDGIDTVRGGAGDDTILVVSTMPAGAILDGGDGFDRIVLQTGNAGALFSLEDVTLSGIERIDLGGNQLRIHPEQLDGVSQITGFAPDRGLVMASTGSLDLGQIVVGDGSGIGEIRTRFSGDFTWDATGATGSWRMYDIDSRNQALLIGGDGDDTIRAHVGDTVRGGAGDDVLELRSGSSNAFGLFDGGGGDDTLRGTSLTEDGVRLLVENVETFSGFGRLRAAVIESFERFEDLSDLQMATPGSIDLTGKVWSGGRTRNTGAEEFRVIGSDSSDSITYEDTRVAIHLWGGWGNDTLTTGAGNDVISNPGIIGGSDDDLIRSGDGSDTVRGGIGDDTIIAWGSAADGADVIEGGAGTDSIEGGAGNDVLAAEARSISSSEQGTDTIDGGTGGDLILGSAGDNLLIGGPEDVDQADRVYGRGGDDTLQGGAGNDLLSGDGGADSLMGGTGADTLMGGEGDDILSGGSLSDLIFGGDGMDFINGGTGSDRINTGAGADRVFHAGTVNHGSDWIQDFTDEDALVAVDSALATDFQINFANTAGAGDEGVEEAFVIYRPTGQIFWALVDGGGLNAITLRIDEVEYDLLA